MWGAVKHRFASDNRGISDPRFLTPWDVGLRQKIVLNIERTWTENQVFQANTETENVMKKTQDNGWRDLDVLGAAKAKGFIFFWHRIIEKRFIVLFLLRGLKFLQTETGLMYFSVVTAFIKDRLSSKTAAAPGTSLSWAPGGCCASYDEEPLPGLRWGCCFRYTCQIVPAWNTSSECYNPFV